MPPLLFLFLWNGQQRIHILLDGIVFLGFGSCGFVLRKEPFLFCVEISKLRFHAFANIGQIPNFDKLIATIRSREISASIILQSQSQLKTIYKDAADTIVGNCDSTLFLGGKEKSTLKEISELLGKETIDLYNQSENRGSQISHGLSYQKLGKELMTQDELAVMDGDKCIFMLRGVRPFLSDKYDLTRHPNYRYTADADPKNVFDMERYMKKQRAVVKPTDTFDVYEINATT